MALVVGPAKAGPGASSRTRTGREGGVAARILAPGVTKNGPGNTCTYVYDGLGRMVRQVCDLRVGGTGAGAIDTSNPRNPDGQISLGYVFDKNSRLVGIVDDNGNRTSFGYDALDRRVNQTNADGEQWLTTYDKDDNVRSVVDPNGSVITKAYDALNRLLRVDVLRAPGVGGTTVQTFAYDGASRLVQATDDNMGGETCEWVFDSLGRVLEERQSGRVVSSRYTGDGKRAQVTYPGGRTITRTFDGIDRIKTLVDGATQLASSEWIGPGMRELRRLNGNGTRLTFLNDAGNADIGYDAVQRIVRLRCVLPDNVTAFVDRAHTYNRASQRTSETRHDDAGLTDTFSYDSAYRVVASAFDQAGGAGAVPREVSAISYQLDGVGNRRQVQKTVGGSVVTEAFAVNAMNEYTSVAGAARTHDDNGNLTDDATRILVWDAFNRLVAVARKSDGAAIAAYSYLPDGRRSRKVVFSQTSPGDVEREVRFAWDGAQEVEEQSAAGVTLATFVWSPVYVDELVEFRREAAHPLGAGSFYAHQDVRCDVVAVTNGSGQVVEKRRYDDFGREEIRDAGGAVVASSPSGLDYGFQGRRRDAETGWLYFRARFYDPEVGRFLSRDPVWDAGNVGGWYTFVGNGPVSRRDPSGRDAVAATLVGGGVAEADFAAIVAAGETGLAGGAVAVGGIGVAGGVVVVGLFVAYQGAEAAYYGTNEDLYFGKDVAARLYAQKEKLGRALGDLRAARGDEGGAGVNATALDRVLTRQGILDPAERRAAHDEMARSGDIFKAFQAAKRVGGTKRPKTQSQPRPRKTPCPPTPQAKTEADEEGEPWNRYYHGTDVPTALDLLRGGQLDANEAAQRKIDGPAGFFLATDPEDATFFAARRSPGTVLQYDISPGGLTTLRAAGAYDQAIPSGPKSPKFAGRELVVPPQAFPAFNSLRSAGEIRVTPFKRP